MLPENIFQCEHIKINGLRCGSPALKGERFCYFHQNWRNDRNRSSSPGMIPEAAFRNLAGLSPAPTSDRLPLLEDADAVQCAIFNTLQDLRAGRLDHKTAALLLYGLQIASSNLRHVHLDPCWDDVTVLQDPLLSAEEYLEQYGPPEDGEDEAEPEDPPRLDPRRASSLQDPGDRRIAGLLRLKK